MSDQQPNFDTATFSPSPFDTFQVPISDIVTQSVEDALAASPIPATPETPAGDEPTPAEAVAAPEAVAPEATEAIHREVVNSKPIEEPVVTPEIVNEDKPTAEVEIPAVAVAEDEPCQNAPTGAPSQETAAQVDEVQISKPVNDDVEEPVPAESQSTELEIEAAVEMEVPKQEVATFDPQQSPENSAVASEAIEEEEFITTEIDDVLIPPPVAVQPIKEKEAAPKDLELTQATGSSPAPKSKIRTIKITPVAQPAPAVQPALEAQPAEEFLPIPVVKPVAEPVVEAPAAPIAKTPAAPAVQPAAEATQPINPKADVVTKDVPVSGFRALELREEVQQAIETSGYTTPTEIQSEIIPHVLAGRDVLAQSQTGTGKTAAFALPILSKINVAANKPQVLVLAPTRELAMQVADSFTTYGKHIPRFDVAAVYGGQSYDTQLRKLRRGVPVVVGTPGRVIDHIKRRTLDLSELECLVLDEADEMLNMGFLDDVKFVLEQTPKERQVALFSATLPGPIQKIAQQYLNDPVRITIKRKTMTADAIRQRAVFVAHRDKLDVLSRFLDVEETDGVIIFTKTREATVTVAEHLVREGFKAVALNGDMPQNVRERTISQLKSSRLDVLVATDVAARGLDVSRISHVFNFDVPQDTESYIHRIGRTGRAGRKGEAIILLSNSQRFKLKQIERLTKQRIQVVAAPTANDINAARVVRFKQKITEVIDGKDLTQFTEMLKEYATESGKSMEEIAAAMADIGQNGRPFFIQENQSRNRNRNEESFNRDRHDRGQRHVRDRDERPSRQPRRAGRVEMGMDRYRIEVGHDDGVKPGNIVGAVANEGGIEGEFIGPINIFSTYSTIDLPEGMPREVFEILQGVRVAGKPLRMRRASEADSHGETGGGRSFKPRGPKRFGGKGKPRSGGPGGNFDHRNKRRPSN